MSQEALGRRVGWLQMTVARAEAGSRPLRVDELFRVAEALGVEPSSLVSLGDEGAASVQRLARVQSVVKQSMKQILEVLD